MSCLRWWAEKVNKPAIIARDNSHYGNKETKFVTNTDKGQKMDNSKLSEVKDNYIKYN